MKNEQSVKIIVATHKKYQMPKDEMYIPLHVGAKVKKDENGNNLYIEYAQDNTGENISELNSSFCELTGLYWAWKNLKSDYIGLVHYRRHFSMKGKSQNPFDNVLTYSELQPYLGKIKVFVPKKRKYYIETLYNHYGHTHYFIHLDETRKIILEKYPNYLNSYDNILKHKYGYMFNMMIMSNEFLDNYCSWLFDILFELNKRIDMPWLSEFQKRYYGRISEIIFNVWLDYQIKIGNLRKNQIKEISYIYMEKINWLKKGTSFLQAKFKHKKYDKSF